MRSDTEHPEGEALLSAVRQAARRAGDRPVVVRIDGPSGAGKSSLADDLLAGWPVAGVPRLVRMDELYPGWDGLDAGAAALGSDLLAPLRGGGTGHYRRWDWVRDRPGEPVAVDADRPVVVEGCGTLAAANLPYADLTVWLDADDALRKRRALARDGEVFAREWDRWQAQFERYVERERPREAAMLRLDVTSRPLGSLV
jgi:uridine kinase